jgi:hypothetical protein
MKLVRFIRQSLAVLLALLAPLLVEGQYVRRRGVSTASPASLGAYKGVAGEFHGKLKELSKKEIVIETEESQIVTIRRSGKTKFLKDSKPIKPSAIDLETPITIEAAEDTDLSLLATNVTVDPPPKKEPAEKPDAK